MSEVNACDNCKFYKPSGDAGGSGDCRRHPPVIVDGFVRFCVRKGDDPNNDQADLEKNAQGMLISSTYFPVVGDDWWCGEWQPKDPAQ